jgi:predicted permease
MRHDFLLAYRSLRRQRGLVLAVVSALSLSVAASTALFSVADALLFRPLPFRDADRIVHIELRPGQRSSGDRARVADAIDRARQTSSLRERAEAGDQGLFDVVGPAVQQWGLRTRNLSPSAFDLLGVEPFLGRRFVENDERDTPFAVLLGYDLWRTRFGGDETIVGRRIQIPGSSPRDTWRVVGVMPRGFSFPDGGNFWIPKYEFYASSPVPPFARLADEITLTQVRAELPEFSIVPLADYLRPSGTTSLVTVLAAVGLFSAIACLQISGLLLARTTSRMNEVCLCLALGATRAKLIRRFATEGALLLTLSLGIALLLITPIVSLIVQLLPAQIVVGQSFDLDARSLAFAVGLAIVGVLFFTVVPADFIRRSSPGLLLSGAGAPSAPFAARLRHGVFIGQLAATTCAIYLTSLLFQSYVNTMRVDLGFAPARVAAVQMPSADAPIAAGSTNDRRAAQEQQRAKAMETMAALKSLGSVVAVSAANAWPTGDRGIRHTAVRSNIGASSTAIQIRWETVMPDFSRTLGLHIDAGSEPSSTEVAVGGPPRIQLGLVNQTLAKVLEPFGPVVGQVLSISPSLRFRITGVIADARFGSVDEEPEPTLFGYLAPPAVANVVLIRFQEDRTEPGLQVEQVVKNIWGDRAPRPFMLSEAVARASVDRLARLRFLAAVAIVMLPLTVAGIAGAVSYAIGLRRKEIAVRQAIGATTRELQVLIGLQTAKAVASGIAGGLIAGVIVGRAMSSTLFGVQGFSALALCLTASILATIAFAASALPLWRIRGIGLAATLRDA